MKKYIFLMLFVFIGGMVYAQPYHPYNDEIGKNTTFIKNKFWDNWFIGGGAGANIYFGDKDANADFWNRLTVTPAFQFGKWFTPFYAMRIKAAGLTNLHTFNNEGSVMSRNKYASVEMDFLWNMTDYYSHYKPAKVYSLIPFVGLGWAYGWDYWNLTREMQDKDHVNSFSADIGLINRFRFSERIALDIEVSAKCLSDDFDLRTGSSKNLDVLGTVTASLIINISKKATFNRAALRNQQEIDDLYSRLDAKNAEIARLANRPPETVVEVREIYRDVPVAVQEPINSVVLFNINETKVEEQQEVNVFNVVRYLRDNPNKKVRIVGYTDSQTGTAAINEKLSRERAQNVSDLITGKYRISRRRVSVEWEGQKEPPFPVEEWNRSVILFIE